jgi:hypothetical protein
MYHIVCVVKESNMPKVKDKEKDWVVGLRKYAGKQE